MKITISAVGTRGDVQPMLALGAGLIKAGHQVTLATHQNFADVVRKHGLSYLPLAGNPVELLQTEVGMKCMNGGFRPLTSAKRWLGTWATINKQIAHDIWQASQGADLVIGTGTAFWAADVAEALKVPYVNALLWPGFIIENFPPITFPQWIKLGKKGNVLLHCLYGLSVWFPLKKVTNEFRTEILKLPPISIPNGPAPDGVPDYRVLLAVSPQVVSKPTNWDGKYDVTGYWFSQTTEEYQPPEELASFLATGPTPICLGFGSIGSHNPTEFTRKLISAIELTGQRAILLTGWGGIADEISLPDNIIAVESVPHEWLFPKVSTVVSHGGAGTTSAVLRSGIPPIILPSFHDQFFWGSKVRELGVGPKSITKKKMTVANLARAIDVALGDVEMRKRAKALGERIRSENGVNRAISSINKLLGA